MGLVVGLTGTLKATINPSNATNQGVTWSSNNTSVATVSSSGVVTAKATGSATITVRTDDGGKTATCTVTVSNATVAVTGVSVSPTSLSLTAGETYRLTPTVSPSNATNTAVSWASSNTSVATVASDGTVTAKAAGSATVTCTTQDGNKTASCSVTVKNATVSVTGVSLDKTSLSLEEGKTATLAATVSPSNATNKAVTWSSSNTSVATVSTSGVVTAKSAGSATITCTTEDGAKKATCAVTVSSSPEYTVYYSGQEAPTDLRYEMRVNANNNFLWFDLYNKTSGKRVYVNEGLAISSSDLSVANSWVSTVQDGTEEYKFYIVDPLKSGTATITFRFEGKVIKTVNLTVVQPSSVAVTGVSLDQTTLSLEEGKTATLAATVSPSNATNKAVTWSSSNTSVATVSSSGVVTAKAAGSATITCTTEDGAKKATCSVTVSGATTGTENGHEWVDLGLPSGIKWAKTNVGSSSSYYAGEYYAWGETSVKNTYEESNYKWLKYVSPNVYSLTKYCTNSSYGTKDGKTTLESSDDIASREWGGKWRMPTKENFEELLSYCTWSLQTSGTKGYKVTSKVNGNSIFLPVCGSWSSSLVHDTSLGNYWTSSTPGNKNAYMFEFNLYTTRKINTCYRTYGLNVRPVIM